MGLHITLVFILVSFVFLALLGPQQGVLLAGTSPQTVPPQSTTVIVPANPITVPIQNFQFIPQQITITSGTTVVWVNQDTMPHTSTSIDMAAAEVWDSGTIAAGGSYAKTFSKPGIYTYHCTIHPTMQLGTVIVQAVQPTPTPTPTSTPTPVPTPIPQQVVQIVQLPSTGVPLPVLFIVSMLMVAGGFTLLKFGRSKADVTYLWRSRQSKIS